MFTSVKEFTVGNFLSVATIIILFGYITYTESTNHLMGDAISDEGVMPAEYEDLDHPFPAVSFNVPSQFSLAGEPVPLDVADVRERFDKELQINCYLHSNTLFLMKRANRWLPQMKPILERYNIPDDFKYLPLIESNLLNVRSPRDAVGYWQILKDAGKEFGLEITTEVDERYDPLKATEAACKYLAKAYKKFGSWSLVAASYNRGMSGVQRAMNEQHETSLYDLYLNEETSRYVFRIMAIKEIIENPLRYGFKVDTKNLYTEEPLRYVDVTETIPSLITFAKANGTNYKLLKRHNPWLREDRLTVKKGKTYRIALPA